MTSTTGKLLAVALFSITEGMFPNFGTRALKRKKWNTVSTVHSSITAVCWKDKNGVHDTHLQLRGIFGMNLEML
jgi:hypothetical protein